MNINVSQPSFEYKQSCKKLRKSGRTGTNATNINFIDGTYTASKNYTQMCFFQNNVGNIELMGINFGVHYQNVNAYCVAK